MNAAPALIDFPAPNLVMVPIMGDRMSPRMREGRDAVYYTPSRFFCDDIYVLDWGGGVRVVTYVQAAGAGRYRLFGENRHYQDDIVTREDLAKMMLGVVVCEIKIRHLDLFNKVTGRVK